MQPSKQFDRLQYELGLDKQTTRLADVLYGACDVTGISNGRSTEMMATACVYLAIRELEKPVSLSDLEDASELEKSRIVSAYQDIVGGLSIQLGPESPEKYVTEYVRRLDDEFDAHLGTPVVERAKKIIKANHGYTSSTASGIAAGAIYVAADLEKKRLTQEEVGEAANLSPATVRKNALLHRSQLDDP